MQPKHLIIILALAGCTTTPTPAPPSSDPHHITSEEFGHMIETAHHDLYNKLENPSFMPFRRFMETERANTIGIVVRHIRDCEKPGGRRILVANQDIPILGILRAAEAADVIVEHLDTLADYPSSNVHMTYPAINALISIGSPATPSILKGVTDKDRSDDFLRNAATVLDGIYGAKIAHIIVSDGVAAEPNPEKKARLEKLLKYLPPATT